ncbi:helix-turn-helix domain-containing protein [Aquimarina sediminis]|uniref:helix-turn-helix domain-containing protein n=1 Tax=Aquimarina sediminis TaxID=2070536 RepID=UPI0013E8DC86|nr:helix-turn-helix domain-containing protein [Aquimarina sediminis]
MGVVHGFFLAIFLWIYPKGNTTSNKILSVLLIVLSFRIGKSVLLEFAQQIDVKLIFIGLGTLMAIGPLYYLFTQSVIEKEFKLHKKHLLHFVPTLVGVCFGFWINDLRVQSIPKLFFVFLFLSYYGHYLTYLIFSYSYLSRKKKAGVSNSSYEFLRLLFYALLVIWIAYFLNLFDEFIPYIVGAILYTCIAYIVSFIVIQKGYIKEMGSTKYRSTPISDEQISTVFDKIHTLVVTEEQFKNPDLTLKLLSKQLHLSTQVVSLVINKKNKTNFNSYINHYRVEESIAMFQNEKFKNHTIAAIAFEVGFNSISSFNSAFKKQTGKTPLVLRKSIGK